MKRFAQLMMICAIAAGLSACAAGRWEKQTLIDQRHLKVSLEKRIGEQGAVDPGFRHPADVAPEAVSILLEKLYYPEPAVLLGAPREHPVFQPEEIARLAPALSAALAKATPAQRVHFTSLNKGGGLIFKDRRETVGIAFVDADGRLNLAFSNINRVIEYDEGARSGEVEKRDPLVIERTDTPVTAKAPYIGPLPENAGNRPMWVAAKLEALETAAAAPKPAVPAPEPGIRPESGTQEEPAISEPARPTAPPAPAPAPAPAVDEQLRTKLEYLKELYEDDLISREEYEAKKRELLEQIR